MKNFSRILALLLAALMLIPFTACGDVNTPEESKPKTETAALDSATEPAITVDPNSVPDEDLTKVKYNKTVSMFGMTEYAYQYMSDSVNGEVVNDAVYARNSKISEDLGITFTYPTVTDNGGQHTNYTNVISASYKSNDSESHQILNSLAYYAPSMITNGYLYDFASIPNSHMNVEKNYWNTAYVNNGTINGKYYFAIGDMSIRLAQMLEVVFLNDQLGSTYLKNESKNMYQLVYDHEFTFEKFKQLLLTADNGEATGVYGAILPNNSYAIDGFLAAFELDLLTKNPDGSVEINTSTEHNIEVIESLRELYYNNTCVKADTKNISAFSEAKSVFTVTRLIGSTKFQEAGIDYSIYPLPLWNADQKDYVSTVHDEYTTLSIISTVDGETAEMLSAVLEYMNYLSTDSVYVAMYDITFKTRYSDSAQESEMFDYIYDRINISTGIIYSFPCGELKNTPRYLLYPTTSTAAHNMSEPVASTLTSAAKGQKISIKNFLKNFSK